MHIVRAFLSVVFLPTVACGRAQRSPPKVPISIDTARETAFARVPGQVQEEELEEEDGRWVYEFDIMPRQGPGPVQEVVVDASTGQIILVEADD